MVDTNSGQCVGPQGLHINKYFKSVTLISPRKKRFPSQNTVFILMNLKTGRQINEGI